MTPMDETKGNPPSVALWLALAFLALGAGAAAWVIAALLAGKVLG